MRVLIVTLGTLFIVFIGGLTTKLWGKSQHYVEYKHNFFNVGTTELPLMFVKPSYAKIQESLESDRNLYLDVAFTSDQVLVLPTQKIERGLRYYALAELKDKVIDIDKLATYFTPNRKIILNMTENTRAIHEVLVENLTKVKLEQAENILFISEYEAPLKSLKEIAPSYLFGTSKPEILKLVAMKSMYLLEAATLRADVLVHPLKIRNQDFYTEDMLLEMARRLKKIIVGPIAPEDLVQAQQLKTFGIIVTE